MDKGEGKFTFLWWLENFYFCWPDNAEKLTSPKFTFEGLEGTAWTLVLHRRDRQGGDKRGFPVFLSRSGEDDGPESIQLMFEFSCHYVDESRNSSGELTANFEKGQTHEVPWFLDVFGDDDSHKDDDDDSHKDDDDNHKDDDDSHKDDGDNHKDDGDNHKDDYDDILDEDLNYIFSLHTIFTLHLRCRMWKSEGISSSVSTVCAVTRLGFEDISTLQKVEKFSSLQPNQKNSIQVWSHSKKARVVCNFQLDDDGEIMFEVLPCRSNHIPCAGRVSLLSSSGNVLESTNFQFIFANKKTLMDCENWTFKIHPPQTLLGKKESLLDDTLLVLCRCLIVTGVDFEKILETKHETPVATLHEIDEKIRREKSLHKASAEGPDVCSSVSEDLNSFYRHQQFTDVELKTKTKSFPAHAVVLCVRSPVLEGKMGANSKKCIQVDDLEDDTVQQMLLFLYSDSLENPTWADVAKLYRAAWKYEIEKLRLICASFLTENLSTSNAGELLLLADSHNDVDLKRFVEDFILENDDQVFDSEEWKKLRRTNVELCVDTMLLKYNRK